MTYLLILSRVYFSHYQIDFFVDHIDQNNDQNDQENDYFIRLGFHNYHDIKNIIF
jgi:hypothetical protein